MIRMRCLGSRARQAGFVLPTVIIFMIVVTIAGVAFLNSAAIESQMALDSAIPARTLYLAEAGCEFGKAWLTAQTIPPTQLSPIVFSNLALGDGYYDVTIAPDPDNGATQLKRYTVTGVGKVYRGSSNVLRASKDVSVDVRVESFSHYAYLTDNERTENNQITMWFITGDVIHGPAHSNSQIHVSGSPTFESPVSSTASSFDYLHGGPPADNPDFQEGYRLDAVARDLNALNNLARLETAANNGGLRLQCQNAEIVFNATGTISYRTKQGSRWSNYTTRAIPSNGVIFVTGDAIVRGTVHGQATVAVADGKNISIPSDIRYAGDPFDPDCADLLGLVAGQSIVVTKGSPAGASLTIHASLMAFGTHFTVDNYDDIPVMGKLTIVGGIIQKHRGPVGTFNSYNGNRLSGYVKDYWFDDRLTERVPPYFPVSGKYETLSWGEQPVRFTE